MPEENKTYTLDEISQHQDKQSVWVLIHGSVYDVTSFLEEHPGGEEVLLDQGGTRVLITGKNATEAFEDIGHSTDARELMKQYKIGELCEEDKKKIKDIEVPKNITGKEPTKKEKNYWPTGGNEEGSWRGWILPITAAVVATLFYRIYFSYFV